jgi:hypothetical protein
MVQLTLVNVGHRNDLDARWWFKRKNLVFSVLPSVIRAFCYIRGDLRKRRRRCLANI